MSNQLMLFFSSIRRLGRCDHVHFDENLNISTVEFGPSLCHFILHIGKFLLDLAYRRECKIYNERGYADIIKETKPIVQFEIHELTGLRVGEPRVGGAGTSE